MKKQFLILPLLCSSLFWACGDSSSTDAPADSAISSVAEGLSSDSGVAPQPGDVTLSSASVEGPVVNDPTDPTVGPALSSSSEEVPVDTDPYAVGTDIDEPSFVPEGCSVTPLESGKGDSVACDGVYKGTVYTDTDESVYDPAYPDKSIFVGVDKVFNALQPDEKVVFVLRHAERNSSSGRTSHLTEFGVFSAQVVGKKIASDEPAYYAHSEYVRTRETLENIAKGRGETGFNHEAYGVLNGNWFYKDEDAFKVYASVRTDGNYIVTTDWAYNGGYEDAFYDLDTRAKQFIDEFLVGVISKKARISVVNTHDQFLVPLTIYASDRKISLKYFEDMNWITYLAGIAVVIKADGSVVTFPVKGLNSGN